MRRVLVITEDAALARLVSWIVVESRREAVCCTSADDALSQLDRLRPDLILLDGAMGARKRADADRLNDARPEAPIVGLHSHAPDRWERHIRADAHLHKPFDAHDLLAVIDALVPVRAAQTGGGRAG